MTAVVDLSEIVVGVVSLHSHSRQLTPRVDAEALNFVDVIHYRAGQIISLLGLLSRLQRISRHDNSNLPPSIITPPAIAMAKFYATTPSDCKKQLQS